MSELSLETSVSNFKPVGLTILELLAFNAQKFREFCDPAHTLSENFKGSFLNCPWEHACQIWSPVVLTVKVKLVWLTFPLHADTH